MSGDITMVQVIEALREVYNDDGVAIFLAVDNPRFNDCRAIDLCRTPEGRYEVWAWAQAATGMVAT